MLHGFVTQHPPLFPTLFLTHSYLSFLELFLTVSLGSLHTFQNKLKNFRIVDTILSEPDLYTAALRGSNSTLQVGLAPTVNGMVGSVDMQCATEAAAVSVCNCRGCRSRLKTLSTPSEGDASAGLTSSAPGFSVIGPILETSVDCWCNGGDPQPPAQEPINCLSPDACLNGGFCRYFPDCFNLDSPIIWPT